MRIRKLLNPKFLGIFGVVYTVALLILSLIRTSELTREVSFSNADKVFHCLAYFGLTLIWTAQYYAARKERRLKLSIFGTICGFLILFGIIVELLQLGLTDYRSFDAYDVLANLTGMILAGLCLLVFRPFLHRLKEGT